MFVCPSVKIVFYLIIVYLWEAGEGNEHYLCPHSSAATREG